MAKNVVNVTMKQIFLDISLQTPQIYKETPNGSCQVFFACSVKRLYLNFRSADHSPVKCWIKPSKPSCCVGARTVFF